MKTLLPLRLIPLLIMQQNPSNSEDEYLPLWREMRDDLRKLVHLADPPNPEQTDNQNNPPNGGEDDHDFHATNSETSSGNPSDPTPEQPLNTPAVTEANAAKTPEANQAGIGVETPPPPIPPHKTRLPWKRNQSA